MNDNPNIECYKCRNYGHIARYCRYKMEPNVNEKLDSMYKKFWRRKQIQEDQADEKVSIFMLSGFVMVKGHDEST